MRVSFIVAAAENDVIGYQNRLPWRLPADLARFRRLTLGHAVIMGRKTFQSIGRALPGRQNIVLTRSDTQFPGCQTAASPEDALSLVRGEEAFVLGGEEIFRLLMPFADRIYLTRVHLSVPGDAFFRFDESAWEALEREERAADAENPADMTFFTLTRIAARANQMVP